MNNDDNFFNNFAKKEYTDNKIEKYGWDMAMLRSKPDDKTIFSKRNGFNVTPAPDDLTDLVLEPAIKQYNSFTKFVSKRDKNPNAYLCECAGAYLHAQGLMSKVNHAIKHHDLDYVRKVEHVSPDVDDKHVLDIAQTSNDGLNGLLKCEGNPLKGSSINVYGKLRFTDITKDRPKEAKLLKHIAHVQGIEAKRWNIDHPDNPIKLSNHNLTAKSRDGRLVLDGSKDYVIGAKDANKFSDFEKYAHRPAYKTFDHEMNQLYQNATPSNMNEATKKISKLEKKYPEYNHKRNQIVNAKAHHYDRQQNAKRNVKHTISREQGPQM